MTFRLPTHRRAFTLAILVALGAWAAAAAASAVAGTRAVTAPSTRTTTVTKKKKTVITCVKRPAKRTPRRTTTKPATSPRAAAAATTATAGRKAKKKSPPTCKAKKKKKTTTRKPTIAPGTTPTVRPPADAVLTPTAPLVAPSSPPPPPPAELRLSSPEDGLGLGTRLVFSTVRNQSRPGHALTVSNVSGHTVTVTGMAFGGAAAADFQLCGGQPASFALAPGDGATVCVQYRPTVDATVAGSQVSRAALTLVSDDPGSPYVVGLGGLNAKNYEGANEPSLQQIFDALGYGTAAGVIDRPFVASLGPASTAVGDEVVSAYWAPADPSRPVTLLPVARYSGGIGGADSPGFGWYAEGPGPRHDLYAFPGGTSTNGQNDGYGQNQLLLPTTTTGQLTFSPGGPFGLVGDSWFSDDARNQGAEHWHNFRFYPARDASGATIPDAYLVGEDLFGPVDNNFKNWDYQDYVFLMVNARPASGASGQPPAGEVDRTLGGFTVASAPGAGTTPELGANAGTGFYVQGRLAGPPGASNPGAQQGIYWGPDAGNALKAQVGWSSGAGARVLTVSRQVGGSSSVVASVTLPAASTVDLRLEVDPSPQSPANGDPRAGVSYAVDGGGFTNITGGYTIAIPTGWITADTPAGVVASHQSGSPFSATFDAFTVTRDPRILTEP